MNKYPIVARCGGKFIECNKVFYVRIRPSYKHIINPYIMEVKHHGQIPETYLNLYTYAGLPRPGLSKKYNFIVSLKLKYRNLTEIRKDFDELRDKCNNAGIVDDID